VTAPASSTERQPALELRRRGALRDFIARQLAERFAERAGFVIGIVMATGFAGWMVVLFLMSAVDLTEPLLLRAVRWLSVVAGGLAALGVAADPTEGEARAGIAALLRQRGYDAQMVRRAHLYASARLIGRTVGLPTAFLTILALALSRSVDTVLARLALGGGLLAYVVLLGGTLALCAHWAIAIDRRRSRWVFVALLVGPEIARASGLAVPAIPSLFGALLGQVAALGGGLG